MKSALSQFLPVVSKPARKPAKPSRLAGVPLEEDDQIALIAWFDEWAPAELQGRLAASAGGAVLVKTNTPSAVMRIPSFR